MIANRISRLLSASRTRATGLTKSLSSASTRHRRPLDAAAVGGTGALLAAALACAGVAPDPCPALAEKECALCSHPPPPDEEDDYDDADPHVPDYIPLFKRDEVGSSLDRRAPLMKASQVLLATEGQYPVEHATLTLAPEVPPPIKREHPVHMVLDIACTNKMMPIVGNTKYEYWPFGFYDQRERKYKYGVPGPFIRARQGDVLQVNFTNKDSSGMAHSIDFHSVIGPGGGSPTNFAEQDETKTGAYLLQRPGLYVYHCAAAPIPVHVHNGMFGLILVEPAEGMPPVDREVYIMQNELYVTEDDDEDGDGDYIMDYDNAAREIPRHVVFNGREGALVEKPIVVRANETVRMFVGNAGPNLISSFHVIGTVFDKVWREGDLVSPPARDIQTTLIPSGGACMIEHKMQVPGSYAIVDHSIFRIDKGAVGMIKVKGKPRPDIYDSMEPPVFCPGCKTHQ